MPTTQSFFEKPSSVRDIIGERRIITATTAGLVDLIDGMRQGEAVLVAEDIVPEEDPHEKIPYCSEEDSSLRGERFLKRGPQADLARYYTIDQAVQAATPMHSERRKAFSSVGKEAVLSGYGWWGIRARQHRKVHLADCVQGARIFAFSMQNQHNDARTITVREYNSENRRSEMQSMGGDFICEVPSTSNDGFKHDVLFYAVPIAPGAEKFARAYDMGAEQSARSVTKRVTKRYAAREMYFGKHAIAAYIEIARQEHNRGNDVPMAMCPFALPSQKAVDFYNRLEQRVMIQEHFKDKDGKERSSKRPLNKAEKEILLWQLVGKYGPKETFVAGGKMQEYSWQRMYEPRG